MAPCATQVHVRVTIPQKLGKEEAKLVEELRELQSSAKPRSRLFNL